MGVFHVLSEGFALFLLRNGAGIGAFRHSLMYGSLWGLCTAVVFFFEIQLLLSSRERAAALVFIVYTATLCVFYATMALSPLERFYRRPSLIFYCASTAILLLYSNRIAAAN